MSLLAEIIAHKRAEVARTQALVPLEALPSRSGPVRDFQGALARNGLQVIAEIKRKSPSRGPLNLDLDPAALGRSYEAAGAAAISVLTDEAYFGGRLEHLVVVRAAVQLPVLRKDFIVDPYQVHESFHAGADAILLIADVLDQAQLEELFGLARSLGLHVLVEGHGDESLERIRLLAPPVVGLNARDLATMQVDLAGLLRRRARLPETALHVAESGIAGPADLPRVAQAGYDAALIGTALLTHDDPGQNLRQFLAAVATEEAVK